MTTAHIGSPVMAACCLSFAAIARAMAQPVDVIRVDNWLSFQRNTDNSGQWGVQPRFYAPFNLSGGWTFTQRLDLPVLYTDQSGTDNPTGTWKAGIGDWFIEEIFATPALAENLRMWGERALRLPHRRVEPVRLRPVSMGACAESEPRDA